MFLLKNLETKRPCFNAYLIYYLNKLLLKNVITF